MKIASNGGGMVEVDIKHLQEIKIGIAWLGAETNGWGNTTRPMILHLPSHHEVVRRV